MRLLSLLCIAAGRTPLGGDGLGVAPLPLAGGPSVQRARSEEHADAADTHVHCGVSDADETAAQERLRIFLQHNASAASRRRRLLEGAGVAPTLPITIPVVFHLMTCDGYDAAAQDDVVGQMSILSASFEGTGFAFSLHATHYVSSAPLCSAYLSLAHGGGVSGSAEANMKATSPYNSAT